MRMFLIFLNELRRLRKDTFLFMALLGMPLVLTAPAILGYSDSGGEKLDETPLMVANYDGGQVSLDFIKELDTTLLIEQNFSGDMLVKYNLQADPRCAQASAECDEAVGRARIMDKTRQALLIIPAGLQDAIKAGNQTTVILLYDPGSDAIKLTQLEKITQGLGIKVALTSQLENAKNDLGDLSAISSPEVRKQLESMTSSPVGTGTGKAAAIHVDEVIPSSFKEERKPQLLETVVPGYAVMFAFIMIMFINGWLHEEKANGLLRRLLSTPAGKADLIGGKMIFGTVVNFVQLAVLFGLGLAMGTSRGLGFQFNVVTFILLTLLLSATSTSLGLAFASTKINPALALIPVFAGAILGGCMFSVDILPPYLRVVSYIMPQYYAMLGYQSILLRNADIVSVLPQLGALLAFTLVFFGFSVWKFDMLES